MWLAPFDLTVLAVPAGVVFAATVIVSFWITRSPALAGLLAAAKSGLFLLYFGVVFDGSYTFLDDMTYLERGKALLDEGVGLWNLLDSLPLLVAAGEGDHFLYYLYNTLAIGWFGYGYYAPVALNLALVAGIAGAAASLAVREGLCERRHAIAFYCFVLLHPDITAWSVILNGKDVLVLGLHVALLYAVSLFLGGRRLAAAAVAAAAGSALMFLRFYVPLLFAASFAVLAFFQQPRGARMGLVVSAIAALAALLLTIGTGYLSFAFDLLRANLSNPVMGFLRFAGTPIPFNTDAAYSFLNFPALIHWLLLPAVALGVWRVHHLGTPFSRYLLTYTLMFVVLYALFAELQGPRHRVQLDFAWAVFQFSGCVLLGRLIATQASGALHPLLRGDGST